MTALVIAGAVMAIKLRTRDTSGGSSVAVSPQVKSGHSMIKLAAIGLVVLFLVGTGFFLYHQWQDNYQIVQVHVIDTRSGKEVTYEAYKGDIEARSFLTVTGRQVNLAEVERMELGGK